LAEPAAEGDRGHLPIMRQRGPGGESLLWFLRGCDASVVRPMFFLFLLVLFRVILRSKWIAIVVLVAVMSLAGSLGGEHFVSSFLLSAWAS